MTFEVLKRFPVLTFDPIHSSNVDGIKGQVTWRFLLRFSTFGGCQIVDLLHIFALITVINENHRKFTLSHPSKVQNCT